ncbi:glycoprotein-N-acetylgalactosamine 3-beta-galactosyltransferase 1-like [Anneissia japonica]|uniref:glycoprotein-N-acetylgalactosamine 3-beta-galactosyltransferase 1-like n=1 Tax=Anneissia japonica TaxID=1529436 RepID=UPI0014258985|nr:glycoprotein-N-acetylgalactosamine 3-beta-galactosyltransferase 1-like [Anneissia japonica]
MSKKGLFSLIIGLCVGFCSVFVYERFLDIVNQMNRISSITSNYNSKRPSGIHNIGYPTKQNVLSIDYSIDGTSYFFQTSDHNDKPDNGLSELGMPELDPELDTSFVNYLKRNDFDPRLNASALNSKIRVFCFSITPQNQLHSAENQQKTWGKHCDKFVILSSRKISKGDIIGIDLADGANHAWSRLKSSLQWIMGQEINNYDWIVKVEYDTYLVVENLKYMLILHSTSIKSYVGQVFSGKKDRGSTIALSRAGIKKLSPVIKNCGPESGGKIDDMELQNCFNQVNVYRQEDGRDYTGENRFQLLIPNHEVPVTSAKFVVWYWRFIKQPSHKLPECCSEYAVSYMYASPNNMYLLEYMVYHMRPYGIGYYNCPATNNVL